MKHRLLFTAAVTAMAVGGTAPALAIDYDYVEPRYTFAGDIVDVGDVTGFGLEASRLFEDWFFVRASADFYGVENGGDDRTLDLFSIGPGMRVPLNAGQNEVDLYGALNYQRVATATVEHGIGAEIGLAMELTRDLEGRVQYTTMDDSDVDLDLYEVRLAYDVDSDWAITGSLLNGDAEVNNNATDPDNLVRVGARFRF